METNLRLLALIALASTFCPSLGGQTVTLAPTNAHVLSGEFNRPLRLPVRCDSEQNFYLRAFESGNQLSPVLRISTRSDTTLKFAWTADIGFSEGILEDFAVTPDGEVYELVQAGNDVYVLAFDHDGGYRSKTKLDEQFWGAHIAAFPNGRAFLVTGAELVIKGGPPPKLVNRIFDASGRLLRDLTLKNDPGEVKRDDKDKQQDTNYFESKAVLPLVMGDAQTDASGNAYIYRASDIGTVYVLNSSGDPVRKLEIAPPEVGFKPGLMQVSSGRLGIIFQKVATDGQILKEVMLAVDTTTGTITQEYVVPDALGSAFACYTNNSFGFITTERGKLAIQWAAPH
jgi:hypothetical protein